MSRPPVEHHGLLGRVTRTGPPSAQAVSTHRLIEAAVADGRDSDAAELARYSLVEMAEVFALFPAFFESARRFLAREGVPPADLAAAENQLDRRSPATGAALPDLAGSWHAYEAAVEDFARSCGGDADAGADPDAGADAGGGGDAGVAARALATYKGALAQWRVAHDRACDRMYCYVDLCAQRLGEDRVEAFWDEVMADFYPTRDRFDIDRSPWVESVEILSLDTAETFRGHLSGPGRLGDIDVTDEPGRTVFSFSPCGTGGRTFTESPSEEAPAPGVPMDDPDRFGVTTRGHDWSWGQAGVCLYCVHCCQLQERIPIRRFGYPLRVIEPPRWPDTRGEGRCTWTIYKDPAMVPAEAYERVGETKPAALGSLRRADNERRGAGT